MFIVLYLFLAGLSAGGFATSALAYLLNPTLYRRVIRWGAYLAPFPIAIGPALLVFDLGRPFSFYWLFLTLNLSSPLTFGAWLLALFVIVTFVFAYLWLPESWQVVKIANRQRALRFLAVVGLPLAVGVASYTGLLLAASTRPLWNTPLLAELFLVSGMSAGVASLLIYSAVARRDEARPEEKGLLLKLDLMLVVAEILIITGMVIHSRLGTLSERLAADVILSGGYSLWFWLGVVGFGLLAPLAIAVYELVGHRSQAHAPAALLTFASGTMVLIGGLLLRYVVVYAGQVTGWVQ
jgi:formate-dependent nitrite reductase membrane component NrfD